MASANRFSALVTGLGVSPASAAQRDERLEAIQSMLVQGVEDASCFPSPQPSPFTPGVPTRAARGAGWAVDNSMRKSFHALSQSVMTHEQQERHKFNGLQIIKLQRATAFSCSEGAESVWSNPFSL